jgi:hypothetical protein
LGEPSLSAGIRADISNVYDSANRTRPHVCCKQRSNQTNNKMYAPSA